MTRKNGALLFPALLVVLGLAACGGDGSPIASPASPTPSTQATPPQATGGATISGSVSGVAGISSAGFGARDVVTVTATVGGVTVTATIDGQGKFVLNGVPAGDVILSFTGTNATVTIQNVGKTAKIKIVITVSGGVATVEEQETEVNGVLQLEGRVSSIVDTTHFYVGTTLVALGPDAQMLRGDVPYTTPLKVGDRVHVKGTAGANLSDMTATLVIVQNTNPNVPVNLKGKITLLTPCTSATSKVAQFQVSGYTVNTASTTEFQKGDCTMLSAATPPDVRVKGDVVHDGPTSGQVLATWVQFSK